jgi:acyl carrier protein
MELKQKEKEILEVIKECVVESVDIEREEITINSSFYDDLGLQSLDLEDIFFRLEEKLGAKIPTLLGIRMFLLGDIPEEDFFNDDGLLTLKGLERLQQLLPHRDPQEIKDKIDEFTLPTAFTVRHLIDLIVDQRNGE